MALSGGGGDGGGGSEAEVPLEDWEQAAEPDFTVRLPSVAAAVAPPPVVSVSVSPSPPMAAAPVRILQRPSGARGTETESKPRPVRSLQQRQMDYEAARLRILGEARPKDQVVQNIQIKMDSERLPSLNKSKIVDHNSRPFVPSKNMSVQPRIINQPQKMMNLLRTPRGPDESKGFNVRR